LFVFFALVWCDSHVFICYFSLLCNSLCDIYMNVEYLSISPIVFLYKRQDQGRMMKMLKIVYLILKILY